MGDPTPPGVRGKGHTEAVLRYLQDSYPADSGARHIANALSLNMNTVKGALIRLVGAKWNGAERTGPGTYRALAGRKPNEYGPGYMQGRGAS